MNEGEVILEDKDRSKLDGIVQQMVQNNEPEDAIQFVVNDFKTKYGVKKKDDSTPLADFSKPVLGQQKDLPIGFEYADQPLQTESKRPAEFGGVQVQYPAAQEAKEIRPTRNSLVELYESSAGEMQAIQEIDGQIAQLEQKREQGQKALENVPLPSLYPGAEKLLRAGLEFVGYAGASFDEDAKALAELKNQRLQLENKLVEKQKPMIDGFFEAKGFDNKKFEELKAQTNRIESFPLGAYSPLDRDVVNQYEVLAEQKKNLLLDFDKQYQETIKQETTSAMLRMEAAEPEIKAGIDAVYEYQAGVQSFNQAWNDFLKQEPLMTEADANKAREWFVQKSDELESLKSGVADQYGTVQEMVSQYENDKQFMERQPLMKAIGTQNVLMADEQVYALDSPVANFRRAFKNWFLDTGSSLAYGGALLVNTPASLLGAAIPEDIEGTISEFRNALDASTQKVLSDVSKVSKVIEGGKEVIKAEYQPNIADGMSVGEFMVMTGQVLPETLTMIGLGTVTGGAGIQAYSYVRESGALYKELTDAGVPSSEAAPIAHTYGFAAGQLEKFGFGKASRVLKGRVVQNVLDIGTEATTEALQGITQSIAKETADIIGNRDNFNTSLREQLNGWATEGVMGGFGGGVFKASGLLFGRGDKNSEAAIRQAISDPRIRELAFRDLENMVEANIITSAQSESLKKNFAAVERAMGNIPENKFSEKLAEIVPLQIELNVLTDQLKTASESLVGPIQEDINVLNAKIAEIVKQPKAEPEVTEQGRPMTEDAGADVSDAEYNDFIDNGVISDERLNSIAEKVKAGVTLSEREMAVFTDKTSEIENIIQGEQQTEPTEEPATQETPQEVADIEDAFDAMTDQEKEQFVEDETSVFEEEDTALDSEIEYIDEVLSVEEETLSDAEPEDLTDFVLNNAYESELAAFEEAESSGLYDVDVARQEQEIIDQQKDYEYQQAQLEADPIEFKRGMLDDAFGKMRWKDWVAATGETDIPEKIKSKLFDMSDKARPTDDVLLEISENGGIEYSIDDAVDVIRNRYERINRGDTAKSEKQTQQAAKRKVQAADKLRDLAEKIRSGKLDSDILSSSIPGLKQVLDMAVEAVAQGAELAADVVELFDQIMTELKKLDAYKKYDKNQKILIEEAIKKQLGLPRASVKEHEKLRALRLSINKLQEKIASSEVSSMNKDAYREKLKSQMAEFVKISKEIGKGIPVEGVKRTRDIAVAKKVVSLNNKIKQDRAELKSAFNEYMSFVKQSAKDNLNTKLQEQKRAAKKKLDEVRKKIKSDKEQLRAEFNEFITADRQKERATMKQRIAKMKEDFKNLLADNKKSAKDAKALIKDQVNQIRANVRDAENNFTKEQVSKLLGLANSITPKNYNEKMQQIEDYLADIRAKEREKKRKALADDLRDALNPRSYQTAKSGKRAKISITDDMKMQLIALAEQFGAMLDTMAMKDLNDLKDIVDDIVTRGKANQKARQQLMAEVRKQNNRKMTQILGEKFDSVKRVPNKTNALAQLRAGNILITLDGKTHKRSDINAMSVMPDDYFEGAQVVNVPDPNQFANNTGNLKSYMYGRTDIRTMVYGLFKSKQAQDWVSNNVIWPLYKASNAVNADRVMLRDKLTDLKKKVFGSSNNLQKDTKLKFTDINGGKLTDGTLTNDDAVYIYNIMRDPLMIEKGMNAKFSIEQIVDVVNYVNADPKLKAYADGMVDIYASYLPKVNQAITDNGYDSIVPGKYNLADLIVDQIKVLEAIYGSMANLPTNIPYTPASVAPESGREFNPDDLFKTPQGAPSIIAGNAIERTVGGSLLIVPNEVMFGSYVENMTNMANKLGVYRNMLSMFGAGRENAKMIQGAYGKKFFKTFSHLLQDVLMEKNTGGATEAGRFMRWVGTSNALVMFLNFRGAALQTLSQSNYLVEATRDGVLLSTVGNWFGQAFLSDVAKVRRDTIKSGWFAERAGRTFSHEFTDLRNAKNNSDYDAIINKIMTFGYKPIKGMDSFAIIVGGAPYLAALTNKYYEQNKKTMSDADAMAKAEEDAMTKFFEATDRTQQTQNTMFTSNEQKDPIKRLFLGFSSVNVLYTREIMRVTSDFKNGRTSATNAFGTLAYYVLQQQVIFTMIQQGFLYFLAMGLDEEDEEFMKRKSMTVMNQSVNSILRGLGVYGAVIATLKDAGIDYSAKMVKNYFPEYYEEYEEYLRLGGALKETSAGSGKWRPKTWTEWALDGVNQATPSIGIKARDFKQAYDDKDGIDAGMSGGQAITNLPLKQVPRAMQLYEDIQNENIDFTNKLLFLINMVPYEEKKQVRGEEEDKKK